MEQITWHTELIRVADLIENPNNPKKADKKGQERLRTSLEKFGIIIGGICNEDNMLIDGHSRKQDFIEMGIEEVEVRKPSRQLTEKEYNDLNALYDLVRAGESDMLMIEEILGEDTLQEFDLAKEKEKLIIETVELKPYVRTHILISFPPEKMIHIQEYLQKITAFSFVEVEQGSN